MNTTFWGPSGWKFLHSITALYPEKPTLSDKIIMRDFMQVLCDVLPCKYCRASFTKYSQSLEITPFLESNIKVQEWLYKMHNKVNSKLRRQGFCTLENPSFEQVQKKYIDMTLIPLETIYEQVRIKKLEPEQGMQKMINFICDLGYDFLGSIIFNYQGYFANCHTSDEKTKIIANYHKFFNIIPVMICNYVAELGSGAKMASDAYCGNTGNTGKKLKKIKIRNMLLQNEPYSKLKNWFYECDKLCSGSNKKFSSSVEYEQYFGKHIVGTCNNPIADNVKSCRKLSKVEKTRYSRILSKKHSGKQ